MEGLSWEEKYLRLRDEHTALTHKTNEQDDTIRCMNTKLSQIEKSLKLKYRLEHDGGYDRGSGGSGLARSAGEGSAIGQPRNRENEKLMNELRRYNGALLRENGELKAKIQSLTEALTKKKKELVTAKLARTRTVGGGAPGPRSPCPAARAVGMRSRHVQLARKRSADDMDMATPNPKEDVATRKLSELVDKLRERVSNAEIQLKGVRAENQKLRQDKIDAGRDPENVHERAMTAAAAARRERPGGRDHEEVETLHRELREAQAKVQLIQARFDHLEARTLAQADLHEGSVDKLQETNRQLRDVRRDLQDVSHERDVEAARASRVDDLEETMSELRRQNKELEDQVTRLCESPFISQAFREQEQSDRVRELEQGGRAARLKIDHLQETAQTHHAALLTLQKQTVRLREEKERAEGALQEMRAQHNETETGAQVMADKMKLYAGDEDIDLEELERALTIVKRKMVDPECFPGFLENPEDEEMNSIPSLRRKLQRVQVSNLNLTRELERAERMLKAQMSINRDLHVELEEACRRSTLDRGELRQKLRDFEALALERLTTVHRLEAQVKQLLYGSTRRQRQGADVDLSAAALEQEQESALLSELADGDFSADQNVVEVWVVGAELEPGSLSAGAASFIVVDFFDFESQATPLLPGLSPAYDFATTFKVTVDDFFLRYLGTEGLILELNQARAADFELIGRRQIPLSGLLSSKPRIILQREPLISTRDGAFVGYVHVEVRMALPVTELYALFLERRPEEKARVEQARLREAKAHGYLTSDVVHVGGMDGDGGEASRLRNELEVVILECRDLPARGRGLGGGIAPAAYAHYQLLGFQDVFTPVVHGTRAPIFHHTTSFPVATDEKLLRFLARHRLTVTIMDDLANNDEIGSCVSGNGEDDEGEGLIGEAMVDLSPLADGRPVIAQWVTVEDETGSKAGQVSVSARWMMPLRTGGDPGPHGLSAEEVEGLMARFSPEKDGQVNYVAFLRECDPPPSVLAVLDETHKFLAEAAQKDGLSATEALGAVLGLEGKERDNPAAVVSEELFVSSLLSSGRVNASSEELVAAYAYAIDGSAEREGQGSGGSRGVTLTHLAAFAADGGPAHIDTDNSHNKSILSGWASWVGVGIIGGGRSGHAVGGAAARRALLKARVKCRDAGLLGRSFPGEAFARLDPEGAGRVSRPAFKRALGEMGFALVDESPENEYDRRIDQAKGLPGDSTRHKQIGSAAGRERDLLGSIADDVGTAGSGGNQDQDEIRLRRAEGEELEEEARRRAFREKVEEIERAAAEKVSAAAALAAPSKPSLHIERIGEGIEPRLADLNNTEGETTRADELVQPTGNHDHHPSYSMSRDSGARGPSALGHDDAATLLQSRVRGYSVRRHFGGTNNVTKERGGSSGGAIDGAAKVEKRNVGDNETDGAALEGENTIMDGRGECPVLELEDVIDATFERYRGTRYPPNVLTACAKLDKESSGTLDRARFALALRSLRPALELSPPMLRAAMDFFDTENDRRGGVVAGDSSSIDYRAFSIFCDERRLPEVSPAVNLLRTTILRPGALDVFARRDPMGNGFVSRVGLFDGLRELGVSGTPPAQLQHLAIIFEEAEDMIDYASLVAFASEQPIALRLTSLVSRLRGHLLAMRDSRGVDLYAAIGAFAVAGQKGVILRRDELCTALQELGFTCSYDENAMLYTRLDPMGEGVACRDLITFVVEGPDTNLSRSARTVVAEESTELGKLLRRAQATVVEAAQRMGEDFDAFDKPYLRYDWRRTGRVGTAEFVRATVRCGFPLTRAQIAFLAGLFGDGQEVFYPKFLSWATPGPDGLAGSGPVAINAQPERQMGFGVWRGRKGDQAPRGGTGEGEGFEEDEAELKVRTALQRMGKHAISRAWEAFEQMDPGGKRGSVLEDELVEVLATLGLPVSSRDVAGLMRRFSETNMRQERRGERCFLYPRLLESVAGERRRLNLGQSQDILRHIKAELGRLVRRKNADRGRDGRGGGQPASLSVFESFDLDGTGRVSRRNFRRALKELGFGQLGDDEQAAEVLDCFDPRRDGCIRYEDFLRAVEEDRHSPYKSHNKTPDRDGRVNAVGRTTERERLASTLRRAVAHGIDYRREMELKHGVSLTTGRVPGEDGVISCQSFRSTMKSLGADLSDSDLQDLERRFAASSASVKGDSTMFNSRCGENNRGVRYVELLRWGTPRGGGGAHNDSDEAWEAGERLRQMIRRRFDVWIPGALRKAFRHFDARRKGKLSEVDLSNGLQRLGLELTTSQERALFYSMDLDGLGSLVYPDLVVFARDPNHGDLCDKIHRQLGRVNGSQARTELERRDTSDSGVISEQALGKILARLGTDISDSDLGRLMHRFDIHEDGTANIERVISMLLGGNYVCNGDGDIQEEGKTSRSTRSHPRGRGRDSRSNGETEISYSRAFALPGEDALTTPRRGIGNGKSKSTPKGVTFQGAEQDTDTENEAASHSNAAAALRASLRRLVVNDHDYPRPPGEMSGAEVSTAGPGLRSKLRLALKKADEARGGGKWRGVGGSVDRETVRRAMAACGAPLDGDQLWQLETKLDQGGTGRLKVELVVEFVAGEVEADAWQRLAAELGMSDSRGGSRTSARRGARANRHNGDLQAFIADLGRVVDDCEEVSRRELRKAIERQCGSATFRETELLVLCDSLDAGHRGRISLSDIKDSLRGTSSSKGGRHPIGGVGHGAATREWNNCDENSSAEAAAEAATTALDDLRQLVRDAQRERGIDLLESFEHFDRRGQGEVSEMEFWEGLQTLGLGRDLPRWHASLIVEPFQGSIPGCVRYRDFVEAMEGEVCSSHNGRANATGEGGSVRSRNIESRNNPGKEQQRRSSADDIEHLVDRLKEEIGRLTEEEDGPPPFRRVFRASDQRDTGTLPPLAFRRCLLEELGFDLTEDECETLLDYLDTGGDNNISYREFLQFVGQEVRQRTPPRTRSPRSHARSSTHHGHTPLRRQSTVLSRNEDKSDIICTPPRVRRSSPFRGNIGSNYTGTHREGR